MEEDNEFKRWHFQGNQELNASSVSVRGVYNELLVNLNKEDQRPLIRLCRADPTDFSCFRTTSSAPDAVVSSVQSYCFNGYPQTVGLLEARRLVLSSTLKDFY